MSDVYPVIITVSSDLILTDILSFLIGVLSAILGLGGGFLLVPMYTLIFGLDPAHAIGTSITTTIFTAGSATICHIRNGFISYPLVKRLAIGSVPAACVGCIIVSYLSPVALYALFSLFLSIIAIHMAIHVMLKITSLPFKEQQMGKSNQVHIPGDIQKWYCVSLGVVGGLVTGLSGISAGTVFVPGLIHRGVQMSQAVAVSLAAIVLTSSGAAGASIILGEISYPYLLSSACGVTLGAIIGVRLSPFLNPEWVKLIFSVALFAISFLMVQKVLGSLF